MIKSRCQADTQRPNAEQSAANMDKIIRAVLIGGGVLVAGIVPVAIIKTKWK
jgi:hypothetical protein